MSARTFRCLVTACRAMAVPAVSRAIDNEPLPPSAAKIGALLVSAADRVAADQCGDIFLDGAHRHRSATAVGTQDVGAARGRQAIEFGFSKA